MTLHRRAAKRDGTEREIVAALRACGWSVWPISGSGIPDLLVRAGNQWCLIECKTDAGRLTEAQKIFWAEAGDAPKAVCRTPEEAVAFVSSQLRGAA